MAQRLKTIDKTTTGGGIWRDNMKANCFVLVSKYRDYINVINYNEILYMNHKDGESHRLNQCM